MAKKPDIALIDRICEDLGLTKAQRRLLHEEITGLHLSEVEILEAAIEVQQLYPNNQVVMADALLDPVVEIAPALMGQECWYVSTGGTAGTTFQLSLGGRIPRTYPLKNLSHSELYRQFEGEVGLLVWCAWRLDGPEGPVTSSDDTDPSVEAGLSRLIGARIRTVDLRPRSWDLDLTFSNGLGVRVFCDHVPGDPSFSENWSLYTPRLIHSFGPGNRCSTEAVADPA